MHLPEIDTILGPCINFIPFRARIQEDWTIAQFLQHVKEQALQTTNHDHLDLSQIVKKSTDWNPDGDGAKFGCIFQHQNVNIDFKIELDGIENTSCLRSLKIRPEAEIWVFSFPRVEANQLLLNVRGSSGVLDQGVAAKMVRLLRRTVEVFAKDQDVLLSSVDME